MSQIVVIYRRHTSNSACGVIAAELYSNAITSKDCRVTRALTRTSPETRARQHGPTLLAPSHTAPGVSTVPSTAWQLRR